MKSPLHIVAWVATLSTLLYTANATSSSTTSSTATSTTSTTTKTTPTTKETPKTKTDAKTTAKVDDQGYDVIKDSDLIDPHAPDLYLNFFRFVSRPDIVAPRWNISILHAEELAPGYWWLCTYEKAQEDEDPRPWVGGWIYDNHGELLWSASADYGHKNSWNFQVHEYNGRPVITYLTTFYRDNGNQKEGVILDETYQMVNADRPIAITEPRRGLNVHDFQIVDNGSRVLLIQTEIRKETVKKSDGFGVTGPCRIRWNGFAELDSRTMERTFDWMDYGHIGLDESRITESRKMEVCEDYEAENEGRNSADVTHSNSIDKFPDGDFLLSSRNTNSLYKISARDGSIVWRLGGKKSDFKFDSQFIGQHDGRVQSQNDTHTVLSLLDNNRGAARDNEEEDYGPMRALLLLLRTDRRPMTAEILQEFPQPDDRFISTGRGNCQMLPNGNAFVGWSNRSLHSEYSPSGKLLMKAELLPNLRTYRSFKFPWKGRPTRPPDVYSAVDIDAATDNAVTSIHISWNGQTETSKWKIYTADANSGEKQALLASVPRRGFETSYIHVGFVDYIIAEAIDQDGKPLGSSLLTKTMASPNAEGHHSLKGSSISSTRSMGFVSGVVFGVVALVLGKIILDWIRCRSKHGRRGIRFAKEMAANGWPWANGPREPAEELEHLAKHEESTEKEDNG